MRTLSTVGTVQKRCKQSMVVSCSGACSSHTLSHIHALSDTHLLARVSVPMCTRMRALHTGMCRAGHNHKYIIYIQCLYGIFGREITKYTVIFGVYIRSWPTLGMCPLFSAPNENSYSSVQSGRTALMHASTHISSHVLAFIPFLSHTGTCPSPSALEIVAV